MTTFEQQEVPTINFLLVVQVPVECLEMRGRTVFDPCFHCFSQPMFGVPEEVDCNGVAGCLTQALRSRSTYLPRLWKSPDSRARCTCHGGSVITNYARAITDGTYHDYQ